MACSSHAPSECVCVVGHTTFIKGEREAKNMARVDDTIDMGGNNTLKDAVGRTITVFNKNCVVCGETFKAKTKAHKKCYACKHVKISDAEEEQQVAYQQGRFGINELDDLGKENTFDDDNFEEDTGYSQQEIYEMFSEDNEEN